MPYAMLGAITLVLWVYCLVDVITCPEHEMRNLPKFVWLLIVVLVPTLGSIAWLVAGRPLHSSRPSPNTRFGEYDRPGRYVAQNAEADDEFLRGLRERAEQQRREAQRQEQRRQSDEERCHNSGGNLGSAAVEPNQLA